MSADLAKTLAALDRSPSTRIPPTQTDRRGASVARQLVLTGLAGLLVAGVATVLELRGDDGDGTSTPQDTSATRRATVVFGSAPAGSCLTWPADAPEQPAFTLCRDEHLFEVAESVDMRNFSEPCQQTVRRYLGDRYDPDGRFTAAVLWPGNSVGAPAPERRLLCGLQLTGPDGRPVPFAGKVAELDQSKVWPAGTCLGIDEATGRSTDMPVDCAQPHAQEITGTVDLADHFSDGPPAQEDQQAAADQLCAELTDAYLADGLAGTDMTVHAVPLSVASWAAGSRQVACRVGRSPDGQSWSTLVGLTATPETGTPPA